MALIIASSMDTKYSFQLFKPTDLQIEGDWVRQFVLVICEEQVLAKFEATMRTVHDSHSTKLLLISFSKLFRSNINLSILNHTGVADIHSTNITYKEFLKVISLERYV